MSKIISVFTGGGIIEAAPTVTADDRETLRSAHSKVSGVDDSAFSKVRLVGRTFQAVKTTRRLRAEAEYHNIVIVNDDHSNALDEVLGTDVKGAHSIEVSDAQWAHLESNPVSMRVFLDNILVNVEALDLGEEGIKRLTNALDAVADDNDKIADAINRSFYAEDYAEEWDGDYAEEWDGDPEEWW